jgi:hypothetical protein
MQTSQDIPNWTSLPEMPTDTLAIPGWRREAWHKSMLKKVHRALLAQSTISK